MRHARSVLLLAAVAAAMATGVNQSRLFGPDEPREAEIARETLREGHWIVPRLCGLPFLEKPPLYYDLVALAYAAAGGVSAPVARAVSVLLGAVMLAATFLLARRWRGERAAWLALLVLLTMPRFWNYSHRILLDIGVGAFCSCALACLGAEMLRRPEEPANALLPALFALFSAGAFLTKGAVAVFTVALVALASCAATRRWDLPRRCVSPVPLLLFIVPAGVWVALLYREGGMPYLHEHFVNNLLGRFLQVHFEFAGTRFHHTDLGRQMPWHYYLTTLPETLGPWTALLPLAAWGAIAAVLRGTRGDRHFLILLLIWAFLPAVAFSFSAIKERSYLLPSYAAMAMLVAGWLLDRTAVGEETAWRGAAWMGAVFPFAALSLVSPLLPARLVLAIAALLALAPAAAAGAALARRRPSSAFFPALSLVLCALVVSSAPPVSAARYRKRCLFDLAREAREIVGDRALYLYRPGDNLRGSVAFYADRTLRELDRPEELKAAFGKPETVFAILEQGALDALRGDPSFSGLLHRVPAPAFEADPDNRLIANRADW